MKRLRKPRIKKDAVNTLLRNLGLDFRITIEKNSENEPVVLHRKARAAALKRDFQRRRVYTAEDSFTEAMPDSRTKYCCSKRSLFRFFNRILTDPEVLSKFPALKTQQVRVCINPNPANRTNVTRMDIWKIILANCHTKENCWDRLILLHELSHLLQHLTDPEFNLPQHDPVFAGIELYLVGRFLGKCWQRKLQQHFDANKVQYHCLS
jgi:hypothetical protein